MKRTEEQKFNTRYKKFKNLYFKGRGSFTGLELQECKRLFLLKEQQKPSPR